MLPVLSLATHMLRHPLHPVLSCSPALLLSTIRDRKPRQIRSTATSTTSARSLPWSVGTAAKQKAVSRAPWLQWWPQKPLTVPSCRSSFDVGVVLRWIRPCRPQSYTATDMRQCGERRISLPAYCMWTEAACNAVIATPPASSELQPVANFAHYDRRMWLPFHPSHTWRGLRHVETSTRASAAV